MHICVYMHNIHIYMHCPIYCIHICVLCTIHIYMHCPIYCIHICHMYGAALYAVWGNAPFDVGCARGCCPILHIICSMGQNTLQRNATHCNALQHTATHCNALQRTATHCNALHTLQRTAMHCNTLQHTATHCSTLHCHIPHIMRCPINICVCSI